MSESDTRTVEGVVGRFRREAAPPRGGLAGAAAGRLRRGKLTVSAAFTSTYDRFVACLWRDRPGPVETGAEPARNRVQACRIPTPGARSSLRSGPFCSWLVRHAFPDLFFPIRAGFRPTRRLDRHWIASRFSWLFSTEPFCSEEGSGGGMHWSEPGRNRTEPERFCSVLKRNRTEPERFCSVLNW